jgi:predicted lipoprotein with Yx(FWY)xxD motif
MSLSITHAARVALAIGAAGLGLAACGGGGGEDSANASGAAPGGRAGAVSIQSVDGTDVLTDSQGRTLYSADAEKGGRIRCIDACTSFWEPAGASAMEAESASADLRLELGVVKRPDGESQLTLNGLPLYSFTEEDAGQLKGDGFVDDFQGTHFEWAAATTGAGSGSSRQDTPSEDPRNADPYGY